jgi:hypothetical protein
LPAATTEQDDSRPLSDPLTSTEVACRDPADGTKEREDPSNQWKLGVI